MIDPRLRDFTFDGQDQFYPASRNNNYSLDRPISDRFAVTHFNNFYEFNHPQNPNIKEVFRYVDRFDNRDWKIEVDGLAERHGTFHLGELIKEFGLEERLYRHRCVEAWAMAVPWIGFPLTKLIDFLNLKIRQPTCDLRVSLIQSKCKVWAGRPGIPGPILNH